MTRERTYNYETSIDIYGPAGAEAGSVGEIGVKLTYAVTNWGCIEIVHVGMLTSALDAYGDIVDAEYIPAWGWLVELATEWADEHSDELATDAGECAQGREDANAEARAEARG